MKKIWMAKSTYEKLKMEKSKDSQISDYTWNYSPKYFWGEKESLHLYKEYNYTPKILHLLHNPTLKKSKKYEIIYKLVLHYVQHITTT